jgi:hypothetical protein
MIMEFDDVPDNWGDYCFRPKGSNFGWYGWITPPNEGYAGESKTKWTCYFSWDAPIPKEIRGKRSYYSTRDAARAAVMLVLE